MPSIIDMERRKKEQRIRRQAEEERWKEKGRRKDEGEKR